MRKSVVALSFLLFLLREMDPSTDVWGFAGSVFAFDWKCFFFFGFLSPCTQRLAASFIYSPPILRLGCCCHFFCFLICSKTPFAASVKTQTQNCEINCGTMMIIVVKRKARESWVHIRLPFLLAPPSQSLFLAKELRGGAPCIALTPLQGCILSVRKVTPRRWCFFFLFFFFPFSNTLFAFSSVSSLLRTLSLSFLYLSVHPVELCCLKARVKSKAT